MQNSREPHVRRMLCVCVQICMCIFASVSPPFMTLFLLFLEMEFNQFYFKAIYKIFGKCYIKIFVKKYKMK